MPSSVNVEKNPSEINAEDFLERKKASFLESVLKLENLLKVLSIVLLFATWYLLVEFKIYRFGFIPNPVDVAAEFVKWVKTPEFWIDVEHTLLRVWIGVIAAAVFAIPLGLMIGWKKVFRDLVFPVMEILRPIPGIAYIPLAILFLPGVELPVVFIVFIGAFFPILVNTINGVELIDNDYFRAAKCLGSSEFQIFKHVVVPGALPSISMGLALGVGIGWMASVAGEMISGKWGLGYRIWESYTLIRYPLIVVGMVVIGILGYLSSAILRYAASKLIPWQKGYTQSLEEFITE